MSVKDVRNMRVLQYSSVLAGCINHTITIARALLLFAWILGQLGAAGGGREERIERDGTKKTYLSRN